MKSVRIFYTKQGRMKFVSHLDMNRLMARILRKSNLPVWYTEGFHQHIYINYAVPLSLGFEGVYEVMDIRLTEDDFPLSEVTARLCAVAPEGIDFLRAAEPQKPTVEIAFAEYELVLERENAGLYKRLAEFLNQPAVLCSKRDKKGRMKEFDIIPKIKSTAFSEEKAVLVLACGNEGNLNPTLVMNAFFDWAQIEPVFYTVKRLMLYDGSGKPFV